jgi:hypothetical protein
MRELTDFTFLEGSSTADMASSKSVIEGDDTENTFDASWSESNLEAADPEEFNQAGQLLLPDASDADSLWGSLLSRTASERHPRATTRQKDLKSTVIQNKHCETLEDASIVHVVLKANAPNDSIELKQATKQLEVAPPTSLQDARIQRLSLSPDRQKVSQGGPVAPARARALFPE